MGMPKIPYFYIFTLRKDDAERILRKAEAEGKIIMVDHLGKSDAFIIVDDDKYIVHVMDNQMSIRALLWAFFGDVIEMPDDLKECCRICIIK